ncbi:putative ribonuclease H-like domain-containing protein [Tanacetum coccineum]
MDLETAQTTTTAKLPILKQENGNSFKTAAQTTTNVDGTSTSLIPYPVNTEEKVQKKNDVKARSMLLMALPNEHLMTFNQYKYAKTLFAAIQTRFGGFRRLNKPDLDTMSFDDLYNNFKIVKQEVKGTASSSSSSSLSSHNMAFVSSPSITNEVNTAYRVSTAKTQVSPASTQVSPASTQVSTTRTQVSTTSTQVLVCLTYSEPLRDGLKVAVSIVEKTGRKITINGSDTAGYDKSKVECFNCHKMGHFARECRGPRNQDSRNRNQDSSRRTVNVEETSSKAMVAIDGAGFDWSYMADDEVPTNMALMAFLDSEFNKSEFNLATYKRGLAFVEEQLVFYKKNEVIFCEQLAVLKRDISYKDSEISMLKSELEKLKQEKESNQLKIENFDNASKSLDKLIGSQITDKSRKGVGFVSYNVVPPPHTGLFLPPKFDLSNSGLEEFQQPEFEGYGPKTSKSVSEDISNEVRESPDAPLVKELVLDDKLEKKTVFPTVAKIEFVRPKQQEKPVRKPVKYAKMYRLTAITIKGKGWNMVPKAVLMKTGLRPLNTARPVNTAHPKTTVYSARPMSRFSKSAQSTVKRPYQIRTTLTNKNFSQKVNTAKGKFYTARPKAVNTARPNSAVVDVVKANQGHTHEEDQGYVDNGCSRHMTENISYLSDFKKFDRGYVTFGGGAKGGKITADESRVLLKVPRKNNMYSVDMKNIVPKESLTCLVAKVTLDESMLWHRRLGKATQSLLMRLVAFLENLVDKKVNIIRCDNGTEFKNRVMSEFCEEKGIKKEFSTTRTPQQNDVAERRNRTLIETARSMLADSKLPTTFWAKVVNTACYVQNRVLVVKPHNKTPYELFRGRTHALSFMRPFGCHVTILNTLDYLGKFDGKSDEGFFVGYSMNSKAFRVYNIRTRKVEENLHIRFLEDKPIIAGDRPKWLFDIDVLTKSMNYVPVVVGTNSNDLVGTKESIGAGHSNKETGSSQDYILMPLWKDGSLFDSSSKNASNDEPQPSIDAGKKDDEGVNKESGIDDQERPENSIQDVYTTRPSINTASTTVNIGSLNINTISPTVTTAPLEATYVDFFGDEIKVDMSNITTTYPIPSTPNTRIHKDHSLDHVISDVQP